MLLDYGRIAGRAAIIRQRCGFFDKDPPYSTTIVTRKCFSDLHVTGAALPRSVLEMVQVGASGKVLYYNRKASESDRRVGIAHGLHHLLSDLRENPDFGLRECNVAARRLEQVGRLPPDGAEIACDIFAGELLVPFDVLDRYAPASLFPRGEADQHAFADETDRIASRFNVPAWFMGWRLRDLCHLRRSNLNIR